MCVDEHVDTDLNLISTFNLMNCWMNMNLLLQKQSYEYIQGLTMLGMMGISLQGRAAQIFEITNLYL